MALNENDIRKLIRDEVSHSKLKDMPDYSGFNADHDTRYVRSNNVCKINELMFNALDQPPNDPGEGQAVAWITSAGSLRVKVTTGGVTTTSTFDLTPV